MNKDKKVKIRHLFKFILLYKKQILILFGLGFLSSAFFLIGPYFSKLFIDKAFLEKNLAKFINLSMWGVVVFIFSTLFNLIGDIVKNRISIKLRLNLSHKLIRKFFSLDLSFFHTKSIGENVFRLSDTEIVANFLLEQCPQILTDFLKLLVILLICLWLNLRMTLLLVVLSPLFLIHSFYIQNKLRPIYEEIWRFSAYLYKELHEAFSKILIIKALGLEDFKRRIYLNSLIKNIRWRIKSFRWGLISSLSSNFLSKAVFGVITLYGGWLIIKGNLSLGSYTAVMIYLTQLGGLLESLGFRLRNFVQETVSLEKLFEVLNTEAKIKDSPQAKGLKNIKGEISFRGVRFGYEENSLVLEGLNFTIPAFSWVGIVGPSGCGKTTLFNLILRLYDPWNGEVTLDNQDLKLIKIRSLRENIAIATQQPLLFDASIKENIGYGLKGISQREIEEVARITCIDNFVNQLAEGYDTAIGEDAFRLSQGFKQRVALARAILRKPRLLILDEATSSVDSLTEEKIFQNLKEERAGLTTLIISHRLFSIKDADRIYYLKSKGIMEEGTHQELLSGSQAYRDFFQNQTDQ
ncbi:MAG: ABC transporter ATP-binding protein [Candidatus Omnitrophica bacterium]|nr:ABC transporter ATP-binding protein [Candidatus Omnitrophota bacterium]